MGESGKMDVFLVFLNVNFMSRMIIWLMFVFSKCSMNFWMLEKMCCFFVMVCIIVVKLLFVSIMLFDVLVMLLLVFMVIFMFVFFKLGVLFMLLFVMVMKLFCWWSVLIMCIFVVGVYCVIMSGSLLSLLIFFFESVLNFVVVIIDWEIGIIVFVFIVFLEFVMGLRIFIFFVIESVVVLWLFVSMCMEILVWWYW